MAKVKVKISFNTADDYMTTISKLTYLWKMQIETSQKKKKKRKKKFHLLLGPDLVVTDDKGRNNIFYRNKEGMPDLVYGLSYEEIYSTTYCRHENLPKVPSDRWIRGSYICRRWTIGARYTIVLPVPVAALTSLDNLRSRKKDQSYLLKYHQILK